jgi:glycosyltransferase involved in cell wall biosynthesis
MMINESVMSGTPVAAFDTGVAPDLVITGHTGHRAAVRDTRDLAGGIASLLALDPEHSAALSARCRDLGQRLIHPDSQVRAFVKLMEELTT